MQIKVECYAGYRGEEEPRAFFVGERRVDIMQIIGRWISPGQRYFKVQAYDGCEYILRYDEQAGQWEITKYKAS